MQPPGPPASVPPPANFHCYGENSFTFLLFQELRANDRFRNLLLKNLKQFGTGKNFDVNTIPEKEEADIWLFPNFGKRHGFGEPDALVLFGKYTFWFEVETVVNLQSGLMACQQSLLQMARFHYFDLALKQGPKCRREVGTPHQVIKGPTISNSGLPKEGILRVKKHKVVQALLDRRKEQAAMSHYVLLSEAESTGSREHKEHKFSKELGEILDKCCHDHKEVLNHWAGQKEPSPRTPEPLNKDHCWYAYWRGDLQEKFKKGGLDPIKNGGYVRIKSK